jgi:predicted dehydrogenase
MSGLRQLPLEGRMAVRFGVVGTGWWAEQVHLPVLRDHPGVKLIGLWGRDPARAEATARVVGSRRFGSFGEMLAAVDAVSFCVPPDVQATLAPAAARAGRHLLLEKPLALEPTAAEALVGAIEQAGVAALVFFTRRFVPEFERSIQALAASGTWKEARARIHSGAMLAGMPCAGSVWRQKKGALWDIGPHALSVLLPILGPVREARATEGARRVSTLVLRHASGALSTTTLCLHAEPSEAGQSYRFAANDREASLDAPPIRLQSAYDTAVTELVGAIAAPVREPHRCGVRFALEVVRILAAAERGVWPGRAPGKD